MQQIELKPSSHLSFAPIKNLESLSTEPADRTPSSWLSNCKSVGILSQYGDDMKKDILKSHSQKLVSAMKASVGEKFFTRLQINMQKYSRVDVDNPFTFKWEILVKSFKAALAHD